MKNTFVICVLVAQLLQTAPDVDTAQAKNVPEAQPADRGNELAALEHQLLGKWWGDPCDGDYTINPDGTFELRNFTPGQNTLTGTWSLRWDALPPTLILTCKTSDFKKNDPARRDEFLGKALEVKLLELDSEVLIYRFPGDKEGMHYKRKRPE